MKLDGLLKVAKKLALKLARREIDRIIEKSNRPKDVKVEAVEDGVVITGKNLKSRAVADPQVRDIAR